MTQKIQTINPLVDQFSRTISYLRLSITDRCNLRCRYCMPESNNEDLVATKTGTFLSHNDLLTYEELERIVRIAVSLGMNKLRLTGGEPLVRKGVLDFINNLSAINGLEQIRLTTNGVLLEQYADGLFAAGVRQINVSLDSLQPDKFRKITGRDKFDRVWAGLEKAVQTGFKIKINAVAMRGVNDDEFADFARLALKYPFKVRFIEFMPVGEKDSWNKEQFIKTDNIMERIRSVGRLKALANTHGSGPARMFSITDSRGQRGEVGFISPISHHFCDQCNRLRLTSEGQLRACLIQHYQTDLKMILRSGGSDREIAAAIRDTILNKPKGHSLNNEGDVEKHARYGGGMSRIGG